MSRDDFEALQVGDWITSGGRGKIIERGADVDGIFYRVQIGSEIAKASNPERWTQIGVFVRPSTCPKCGMWMPGHATGSGDICTCTRGSM